MPNDLNLLMKLYNALEMLALCLLRVWGKKNDCVCVIGLAIMPPAAGNRFQTSSGILFLALFIIFIIITCAFLN